MSYNTGYEYAYRSGGKVTSALLLNLFGEFGSADLLVVAGGSFSTVALVARVDGELDGQSLDSSRGHGERYSVGNRTEILVYRAEQARSKYQELLGLWLDDDDI